MKYAIIVHGGAKEISPEQIEAHEKGCLAALEAGRQILDKCGSALDAAEAAVRVLEDDPVFNAGYGSALNADGKVEMDAAIMDGATLRAGAIGAIRGVCHPVSIARQVMESGRAVMLVGDGAHRFAVQHTKELCPTDSLITDEQRQEWKSHSGSAKPVGADTVGCVALDAHGNIAAATSTGGLTGKLPGRVGDSPLPGCGLYANELGGASLTGDGEAIIRVTFARRIVELLENGSDPEEAAESALAFFKDNVPGEAGCIVLDRNGRIGIAHNSANLACAYCTSEMPGAVALVRKESTNAEVSHS